MRTIQRRFLGVSFFVCLGAAACGEGGGDVAPVEFSRLALSSASSYLVSFVGGDIPTNADAVVAAAGGSIAARYQNVGVVLVRSSRAGFATTLRASTAVDSVGLANTVHSSIGIVKRPASGRRPARPVPAASGDPLSFRQWDMDQIHAPQAHSISAGRGSVLVGILDSGIDVTHPDMVGQVDRSASVSCLGGIANADAAVWSNDVIGHGTHVAGIIAGAKNGVGIVGVAPGVKVAAVKVAVDDVNDPNFGLVFSDSVICAIDWGIGHGFDLMNASLTVDPFVAPFDGFFCSDQPDRTAIVKMVRRAVLAAARKNISLIAAAGNSFIDLAHPPAASPGATCKVLPVQLPRVIGVSSVGVTRLLAFYSNFGFGAVDLTGPGGDQLVPAPLITDRASSGQVLSSVPPGSLFYEASAGWDGQVQDCSSGVCSTYAYLQGTSQAAPHIAGVAALAESRFGRLPPEVLLAFLSLTATPLPCPVGPYDPAASGAPANCQGRTLYNNFYGAGEVDALSAVR